MSPEQLHVKNTDEKSAQPVVLRISEVKNASKIDDKVSSTKWDDSDANSKSTDKLSNVAKVTKPVTILTYELKNKLCDELDNKITSWTEADWEG